MIIIVEILMKRVKGAIRDFYHLLTAPRTVSNTYVPVARLQSCAIHFKHIRCLLHVTCLRHVVRRNSNRAKIAFTLGLYYWLKPLKDEEERGPE